MHRKSIVVYIICRQLQLANRHTMWTQFAQGAFGGVCRGEVLVSVQIYNRINHHHCTLLLDQLSTGFAPGHKIAYSKQCSDTTTYYTEVYYTH